MTSEACTNRNSSKFCALANTVAVSFNVYCAQVHQKCTYTGHGQLNCTRKSSRLLQSSSDTLRSRGSLRLIHDNVIYIVHIMCIVNNVTVQTRTDAIDDVQNIFF